MIARKPESEQATNHWGMPTHRYAQAYVHSPIRIISMYPCIGAYTYEYRGTNLYRYRRCNLQIWFTYMYVDAYIQVLCINVFFHMN